MRGNGSLAYHKLPGNLGDGMPGGQQPQYLDLAMGEPIGIAGGCDRRSLARDHSSPRRGFLRRRKRLFRCHSTSLDAQGGECFLAEDAAHLLNPTFVVSPFIDVQISFGVEYLFRRAEQARCLPGPLFGKGNLGQANQVQANFLLVPNFSGYS